MTALSELLPPEVVQQVALALHHRLDAGTVVALLQGTCCSEEGEAGAGGATDITLYVSLAGALALRCAAGCGPCPAVSWLWMEADHPRPCPAAAAARLVHV